MSPRLFGWFALSLLIGVITLLTYSRHVSAPLLANDSYQYLDAASHLASSGCLCTDVAHFDEQVRWGHMPIPFTHFGPGYPVAIAGLELLGVSGERAGFWLSAASFLLVICLSWVICLYADLPPWSIALICVIWSFNPVALRLGVAVGADSLFTAIVMAFCALVAYDIRHLARLRPWCLMPMGALVGAAYWLRQPGLFLIGPLCLYLLWRSMLEPATRVFAMASAALACLGITPVILHNIIYAHSWNSGFANGRHTPWKEVISDSLKAPYHILFGAAAPARLTLWITLFTLAAAVLVWQAVQRYRRSIPPFPLTGTRRAILAWLLVFAALFATSILIAEFSTYAADEVRYNFPVFPILLVTCAALFGVAGARLGRAAALLCVLSIAMIDGRSLSAEQTEDQSSLPADLLQQQVQPGESMQAFIEDHVPANSVLVATEGQALYHLLKRPIVSIIEPQYSTHTWNAADIHSVMDAFSAQYIVVFPGAGKLRAPEQLSSAFLRALANGNPPAWLSIAAHTPGVILYRCTTCSKPPSRSSNSAKSLIRIDELLANREGFTRTPLILVSIKRTVGYVGPKSASSRLAFP